MTDDELRQAYGSLQAQRRAARDEPEAEAPDPANVWFALSGELTPGDRVRILDETLRAGGSDEIALAHSMQSAVIAAVGPASATRKAVTGRRWWPMAVAAALLLTVSVPLFRGTGEKATGSTGDTARFRDAGTSAPVLLSPANDAPLAANALFNWRRVAEARDYTFEAIDGKGDIVARVITPDSVVSLPASVSTAERARITGWWVTANTRRGSRLRSEIRLVVPTQRP